MKTRLFVIVGLVLIIGTMVAVLVNHHLLIREYEENNTPDQLRGIFGNCACQERVKQNPDTNMLCTQPFIDWENATHYIDNNICEWRVK